MINYLKPVLKELGIDADDTFYERISHFERMLMEKNRVMDLTNIIEPRDVALRHMADSLYLLKCHNFSGARVVDIGTGAGFPAMPLLCYYPDLDLTMVDSTGKRMAFIDDCLKEIGAFPNSRTITARAEELGTDKDMRESFDIVTSRAVAPLNILCELCLPLLRENGVFLPLKSANEHCDREIEEAKNAIKILGAELVETHDYILSEDTPPHRVIIIRKLRKTPLQFPRKYAKIKISPL